MCSNDWVFTDIGALFISLQHSSLVTEDFWMILETLLEGSPAPSPLGRGAGKFGSNVGLASSAKEFMSLEEVLSK